LIAADPDVYDVSEQEHKLKNIRWGWILLGGFLAELAIFIVVIPLSLVAGQNSLLYSAPPASFAAAFGFGMWVGMKAPPAPDTARRAGWRSGDSDLCGHQSRAAGAAAYVLAHVLKVLGGSMGGWMALGRRTGEGVSEARSA
jgi:hypothetical protein